MTTVIEGRRAVFADLTSGRILVDEMRLLDRAGEVRSLAFVVMPDHLHWLFVLGDGADLSSVMRRLKGRSARRLGEVAGVAAPVWQRGFHDHATRIACWSCCGAAQVANKRQGKRTQRIL
ncbi:MULTISPECIES: transposase [unclassified Thiocapsa]|uniref:REP-associated tyrosine transposase n=1 Tax=unclassified Thiocapsa TaxID=2641286 RepID=UPI0035B19C73